MPSITRILCLSLCLLCSCVALQAATVKDIIGTWSVDGQATLAAMRAAQEPGNEKEEWQRDKMMEGAIAALMQDMTFKITEDAVTMRAPDGLPLDTVTYVIKEIKDDMIILGAKGAKDLDGAMRIQVKEGFLLVHGIMPGAAPLTLKRKPRD